MRAVLPDTVPTHWNIRGQADAYGSKWLTLILIPAVDVGLVALVTVLPWLGPFRKNFEQFRTTYGRICITVIAAFLEVQIIILLKTAGRDIHIGAAIAVVLGLMMAVMGNWLGKVRRNFYVGIRLPWTLANDTVWEKTHRLGGKLFVVDGLLTAVTGLFAPDWVCFVVLTGGIGAILVWAVAYSLYWYRRLGEVDDLSPGA